MNNKFLNNRHTTVQQNLYATMATKMVQKAINIFQSNLEDQKE